MCVAEWARRMPWPAVGVDAGGHLVADLQLARAEMALVQDEAIFLLRVDDFEAKALADQLAGVADLAAAFAVERRLVEDRPRSARRGRLRRAVRTVCRGR